MKKAKLIGAMTGALLVVIVILQNITPVPVKLLFLEFTLPGAVLIALAWLLGLATGIIVALNFCGKRDAPPQGDETKTP